jgi:hypothetical protein
VVLLVARDLELGLAMRPRGLEHADVAGGQHRVDELEDHVGPEAEALGRHARLGAHHLEADAPRVEHLVARDPLARARLAGGAVVGLRLGAVGLGVEDEVEQVVRVRAHDRRQRLERHVGVGGQLLLHLARRALDHRVGVGAQRLGQLLERRPRRDRHRSSLTALRAAREA